MQLKSIKLENIRSYLNQEVSFPAGPMLLSGDVGSGKSSILLAIEFALFGIRRKHLSGSSLLRNGKNQGSVELRFEIDGKDVIVKRTLKRGKEDVKQEAGYVIIDGVKRAATPIELKTEILGLLGYPKELVTKTKNLVYRYTVYTPQEEMRQILIEEEDDRLDCLRKVFGIDRYKRIRENSLIFVRELKERRKEHEGKIADLEEKKRQKQEKLDLIKELDSKINGLLPKLEEIKGRVKERKERVLEIEKRIKQGYVLKKELEIAEVNLLNRLEQRKRNVESLEMLEKQIALLKKETEGKQEIDFERFLEEQRLVEEEFILEEKKLNEVNNKINELRVRKRHSSDIKEKIVNLEQCPTCEQKVGIEHKRFIATREDERIAGFDSNIESYAEQAKKGEERIKELNNKMGELKKKENEFSAVKVKLRNLEEKEKLKAELVQQQDRLKKEIGEINVRKFDLNKRISEFRDVERDYGQLRTELNKILEEEKRIEIEKNGLEREKQGIKDYLVELNKEIEKKLEIKKRLVYLSELQNWIEAGFIQIMGVMERQVMLNVHSEFNELFKQWFNVLMEDETINARLDERFTPVIEQNGYEIVIDHLSGGERTAAALAYRLALNKVINDLMGTIKTKDLIILDEPTDGFSTEQLDRVREVLDQINIKQVIIVSHESKIESFVDNVIRINKSEHVSEVVE